LCPKNRNKRVVARFTPAILATQEAEIKSGASWFETSPGKKFVRPYLAKTQHKKRAGGVAQGEGPKFKPQYSKKKKKKSVQRARKARRATGVATQSSPHFWNLTEQGACQSTTSPLGITEAWPWERD
jgi:hypothetical protein